MLEVWRDVKGYEGIYKISNLGRVMTLTRKFNPVQKIMKSRISNDGYLTVVFCKSRKKKAYRVHKLVAINFLNHKPSGFNEVVHHIDSNKLNNRVDNLELITQRENILSKKSSLDRNLPIGVYLRSDKKAFISRVYINKKHHYLGSFKTKEDARDAYINKIQE